MSEAPVVQRPGSAERIHPGGLDLLVVPPRARTGWRVLPARVGAMCAVELQKLRHDRVPHLSVADGFEQRVPRRDPDRSGPRPQRAQRADGPRTRVERR